MTLQYSPKNNPRVIVIQKLYGKYFNEDENLTFPKHRFKKFIKDNFKYVGENFAHEARLIHYDPKKKKKSIYGKASRKEIEDLKQEGIKTEEFPWIEDKEN